MTDRYAAYERLKFDRPHPRVLRVTTSSEAMNEVPLFVAEDVESAGTVRRGLDTLLCLVTRWLP